ncbi:hypothetical protein IJ732_06675 [bacterium]|nr:hypothetical protein [bacterium]
MMFFAIQQMNTMKKSKLNFEQSTLQMRKMDIQEQISDIQERNESLSSAFTTITSGVSSQATSIFNQTISESNAALSSAQSAYNEAKRAGLDADTLKVFEDRLYQANENKKSAQQQAYTEYQRQNAVVASLMQTYKNVQAAEEKAQLKALNKEEDRIEIRLNEINTEMAMIDKELESASQASQQRAQELAPKYA